MSNSKTRPYQSDRRNAAAEQTRERILGAAKTLFARKGIDRVTVEDIADKAGVATSTVYAVFKSKEGLLRGMIQAALFGERTRKAQALLSGVADPIEMIALTAQVARSIYESESTELGLLRSTSGFSPSLRKLEQELEDMRFAMQEERVRRLFAERKAKTGLSVEDARRLMWMYTSRDLYRMLVHEGGWPPDRYQAWLADILVRTLTERG